MTIIDNGVLTEPIYLITWLGVPGILIEKTNNNTPTTIAIILGFNKTCFQSVFSTSPFSLSLNNETPCVQLKILNAAKETTAKKTPSEPNKELINGIPIKPAFE